MEKQYIIYPKCTFTIMLEDQNLKEVKARLSAVKTYPQERITRYIASLDFGQEYGDVFTIQIATPEDLEEIIQFLVDLKLDWQAKERALVKK